MLQQQTIEFRSSFTRTRTSVNLTVGQEYVAGSGDEIIFQGQDVLGQHAKLIVSPEGLCVTPIKQSQISVNGHPISELTLLDDGDWLSLGSCLFQINFPDHPHILAQSASPPLLDNISLVIEPGEFVVFSAPAVRANLPCSTR